MSFIIDNMSKKLQNEQYSLDIEEPLTDAI